MCMKNVLLSLFIFMPGIIIFFNLSPLYMLGEAQCLVVNEGTAWVNTQEGRDTLMLVPCLVSQLGDKSGLAERHVINQLEVFT